jgi:hypothetical protein
VQAERQAEAIGGILCSQGTRAGGRGRHFAIQLVAVDCQPNEMVLGATASELVSLSLPPHSVCAGPLSGGTSTSTLSTSASTSAAAGAHSMQWRCCELAVLSGQQRGTPLGLRQMGCKGSRGLRRTAHTRFDISAAASQFTTEAGSKCCAGQSCQLLVPINHVPDAAGSGKAGYSDDAKAIAKVC